jgi:hypothetical protein
MFVLFAILMSLTAVAVACDSGEETDYMILSTPESRAAAAVRAVPRAVPPTLVDVYFPASKFGVCGEQMATCAEASANDSSSIRFEWLASGSDATGETVTVTETTRDRQTLIECIEFSPSVERTILEVRAIRASGVAGPRDGTQMYLYDTVSVPIYSTGPACEDPAT